MDFKEWWNNIDRSESNTSRRNTKRNTAEDAWDHQQKEIDELKKQLEKADKVIDVYYGKDSKANFPGQLLILGDKCATEYFKNKEE